MKYYYKQIKNGEIKAACVYFDKPDMLPEENFIDDVTYNRIVELMNNTPENTRELIYYLDAETETYMSRERTEEEKAEWYVIEVMSENMTLEEVPEEYRDKIVIAEDITQSEEYMTGYDQAVLDMINDGIL